MIQYFHYFEASKHHHGSVICPMLVANCEYLHWGFMDKKYDQKHFLKYKFLSGFWRIGDSKLLFFHQKVTKNRGFVMISPHFASLMSPCTRVEHFLLIFRWLSWALWYLPSNAKCVDLWDQNQRILRSFFTWITWSKDSRVDEL